MVSSNYNFNSQLLKWTKATGGVRFQIGMWTTEEEKESSNYKELHNLVDMVTSKVKARKSKGCKFFLFTDNSTVESCYYCGSSKSKQLQSMVLELQMLEIEFGKTICIVHIFGKRIIAQDTDGCLQGSLMEEMMTGEYMLMFVDLV